MVVASLQTLLDSQTYLIRLIWFGDLRQNYHLGLSFRLLARRLLLSRKK